MKKKLGLMPQMGIIFLSWRRNLQKKLLPHKITLKQYYLLKELLKKEFLNPSQVAEILFCDRPTATVVIKNMEKHGWVKRERDSENAKQIKIYITKEGTNKFNKIETSKLSLAREEYDPIDCLSDEEKVQLQKLLYKIRINLKE